MSCGLGAIKASFQPELVWKSSRTAQTMDLSAALETNDEHVQAKEAQKDELNWPFGKKKEEKDDKSKSDHDKDKSDKKDGSDKKHKSDQDKHKDRSKHKEKKEKGHKKSKKDKKGEKSGDQSSSSSSED